MSLSLLINSLFFILYLQQYSFSLNRVFYYYLYLVNQSNYDVLFYTIKSELYFTEDGLFSCT